MFSECAYLLHRTSARTPSPWVSTQGKGAPSTVPFTRFGCGLVRSLSVDADQDMHAASQQAVLAAGIAVYRRLRHGERRANTRGEAKRAICESERVVLAPLARLR